jgi:hypothetical protein
LPWFASAQIRLIEDSVARCGPRVVAHKPTAAPI